MKGSQCERGIRKTVLRRWAVDEKTSAQIGIDRLTKNQESDSKIHRQMMAVSAKILQMKCQRYMMHLLYSLINKPYVILCYFM